jgi:hypothetical protein
LNANDLGTCGEETAKEAAGGNGYGKMGIHPDRRLEVEGDSGFADVVGLGLFSERFSFGIKAFD